MVQLSNVCVESYLTLGEVTPNKEELTLANSFVVAELILEDMND